MSSIEPNGSAPSCTNCAMEIQDGPYCAHCGQRNALVRLAFTGLYRDLKTRLLAGNLPWPFTLRGMLLRPGTVCRDYVEGQRVRYVNPLKYLLYLTLIALVVLQLVPRRYGLSPPLMLEIPPQVPAFVAGARPVLLAALLAPVIAVLFRLLCARARYNPTEIVCFILYTLGNGVLLALLIHLLYELVLEHVLRIAPLSLAYLDYFTGKILLIALVLYGHTVLAATEFFGDRWYLSWLKVLGIGVVYAVAVTTLFYLLAARPDGAGQTSRPTNNTLLDNRPWARYEEFLLANLERPSGLLEYGNFLLTTGRSQEALYPLLQVPQEPGGQGGLAAAESLAVAYLHLGQRASALSQLDGGDAPLLDLLHIDEALARGERDWLLAVAARARIFPEYNLRLAQLVAGDDTGPALAEIRRTLGDPATPALQRVLGAQWAAFLGDPHLAWSLIDSLDDKSPVWRSVWLPYFSEVRKLPAFKRFVRNEGLADYWRETGRWADACHPIGDDFECF